MSSTWAKDDLYAVGGGPQPFADKAQTASNSGQFSNLTIEGNGIEGAQPQPVEGDDA